MASQTPHLVSSQQDLLLTSDESPTGELTYYMVYDLPNGQDTNNNLTLANDASQCEERNVSKEPPQGQHEDTEEKVTIFLFFIRLTFSLFQCVFISL